MRENTFLDASYSYHCMPYTEYYQLHTYKEHMHYFCYYPVHNPLSGPSSGKPICGGESVHTENLLRL